MKKPLFFILGILASGLMGMELSAALSDSESLTARLFDEAGIAPYSDDKEELKTLAMDAEGAFQNIYLYSYQSATEAPKNATLAELAKRTPYDEEELEAIVLGGDVTVIATHSALAEDAAVPDSSAYDDEVANLVDQSDLNDTAKAWLEWQAEEYKKADLPNLTGSDFTTQGGLMEEYTLLVDLYNQEFELQQMQQELINETLAKELFYDGDLANSGNVDLLFDLDLIHYALYGEFISFPDRSGADEDVSLASESSPLQREIAALPEFVVMAAEEDSISPYACLDDMDLRESLTQFEEDQVDGFIGDSEVPLPAPPPSIDPVLTYQPFDGLPDVRTEEVARLNELNEFIQEVETSKKGNWNREIPCNEIFCVTVNLVTGNEGAAASDPSANCINCHTFNLLDAFKALSEKQLAPGRITTNWFEDATCKEAGGKINLDLNVYGIPKPIQLDPSDDTDEKPSENVSEFKESLLETGILLPSTGGNDSVALASEEGSNKDRITSTPGDESCSAILSLIESADLSIDQESALERCQVASAAIEDGLKEAREAFVFNSSVQYDSELQTQMGAELYTLLLYFSTFNDQLSKTYAEDDSPLPSLLKKEYCE